MGNGQFEKLGKGQERVPLNYSDMWDEKSDPDKLHCPDKYDNDFIWDGETVDDEKS